MDYQHHEIVDPTRSQNEQMETILTDAVSRIVEQVQQSIDDRGEGTEPLCLHRYLIITPGETTGLADYLTTRIQKALGEEAAKSVELGVNEPMDSFISDVFFLVPPCQWDFDIQRLSNELVKSSGDRLRLHSFVYR